MLSVTEPSLVSPQQLVDLQVLGVSKAPFVARLATQLYDKCRVQTERVKQVASFGAFRTARHK